MTNLRLVSIITPTFNHQEYIGRCIESVLAQDYSNWELIIVDDGSTDNTGKIVAGYEDERIKYINQDNLGISNLNMTYNTAIRNSTGELIAILEGDDLWPSKKLSSQIKVFENPEVVLSWGNVVHINKEGEIIERPISKYFKNHEIISKDKILKKLLLGNVMDACTVMIRKTAIIDAGGFVQPEGSPCVDYSTWLQMSLKGKFCYIDALLGCWRRHGEQVTVTSKMEMLKSNTKYSIKFFDELDSDEKEKIGLNAGDIVSNCRNEMAAIYFHWGRLSLYEKRWKDSKKLFKKSFKGSFSFKLKSIVGFVFALCHINFEWILGKLNLPHIRDFGY